MRNKKYTEYWTAKDICRHIPKHVLTYHRDHGSFPPPLPTVVGKTRWKREAVEKWIKGYMDKRKRFKSVDPSIRVFHDEDENLYTLVPPRGLVINYRGVVSHGYVFMPEELGAARSLVVEQCPDFPRCNTCQKYDFNLRAWLALCEEVER